MKLTPGELYFVRETDVLTNEISNYVKIGLVREEESRTSQDRALEHQTGNPRRLHVDTVVKSPAISEIENIMHHLLAENRISGEWFNFTPAELAEAISIAQDLADEANANVGKFAIADSFKNKVSQKSLIQPTPEILTWHGVLLASEAKIKKCTAIDSEIREIFRNAHAQPKTPTSVVDGGPVREDIEKYATVQERKASLQFDQASFQIAHPDLFVQFTNTKSRIAPSFTITRPKDLDLSLEVIDRQLFILTSEVETILGSYSPGSALLELLHTKSLQLIGHNARASWDKEIAQANLKAFCKDAAGVVDVCKWTRTLKETKTFDEKAFVSAFPDIAKEFSTVGEGTQAIVMKRKRAYIPRK